MNVLIVDDQKAIVDSLKNGIRWDTLPVEQVYTACSASEAKLVLMNFSVDVLLSDIEMPEEDGLSLCRWAMENMESLECIFLTSHADFDYAREAITIGSFDYILQPVRYEEVERVLRRVWAKVCQKKKVSRMMDTRKLVLEQRSTILDAMVSKLLRGKEADADRIYRHFREMFQLEYEECAVYPLMIQVQKWKKLTNMWDEELVRVTLSNMLEELFAWQKAKVGVSSVRENRYWVFLVMEKKEIQEENIRQKLEEFYHFINENMDFSISIYPAAFPFQQESSHEIYEKLSRRDAGNPEHKKGIFWEAPEASGESEQENPVEQALSYIKKNLNKNITRTDVADYVHLNEEYFSRLFKQETGDTFKDYLLMEKMKQAQYLLKNTKLSVSIIASKVGYDNFSHFSKMFKKITDRTPQEYRKESQPTDTGR